MEAGQGQNWGCSAKGEKKILFGEEHELTPHYADCSILLLLSPVCFTNILNFPLEPETKLLFVIGSFDNPLLLRLRKKVK
jgi:hypothetical protein